MIKGAKLEALALLLGAGCLLFHGICCGVSVVEVTGKAGKSRCSVKFGLGFGLYCCLCLITFGHSVEEAWCPPPQPAYLSVRCRLGHSLDSCPWAQSLHFLDKWQKGALCPKLGISDIVQLFSCF